FIHFDVEIEGIDQVFVLGHARIAGEHAPDDVVAQEWVGDYKVSDLGRVGDHAGDLIEETVGHYDFTFLTAHSHSERSCGLRKIHLKYPRGSPPQERPGFGPGRL